MDRRISLGSVLQPWPGEALLGRVTAFSVCGEFLVCQSANGDRFDVRLSDVEAGLVPLVVRVEEMAEEAAPESQSVPRLPSQRLTSERIPGYSDGSQHGGASESREQASGPAWSWPPVAGCA